MYKQSRARVALSILCAVMVPLAMAPKKPKEIVVVGSKATVIEERDGSDTLTRQVIYGGGTPLWQILADGSSQYLHEDPRGDVVMLTEGAGLPTAAAGDVLERVTYDPYGKPIFQDAANQDKTEVGGPLLAKSDFGNSLLYMGRWYDPETGSRGTSPNNDRGGLYDFGGRYLNPDEGRFITRSGISDKVHEILGSASRYGFAGHAPVNSSASPRKISGYRTVSDITLKRGVVGGSTHGHLDYIKSVGDPSAATVVVFSVRGITDDSQQNSMSGGGIAAGGLVPTPATVVVFSVRGITDDSQQNSMSGGNITAGGAPAMPGGEGEIIIVGNMVSPSNLLKAYDLDPNASGIAGFGMVVLGDSLAHGPIPIPDLVAVDSTSNRDSEGWYCYDPPWSRPMCCGYSGEVEVCVYF